MRFRNLKLVDYVVYGRGAFDQLETCLLPHRLNGSPIVFLLDHFFESDQVMRSRIPLVGNDLLLIMDVSSEPKTSYVDEIVGRLKREYGTIAGVVGIGGGSTMDLAKAVAIMMTNPGKAEDYQGWDLVKHPAVYKLGIPTLAGTGAEVSRTCVLTGPKRKLGMNSDYTPFNQIILDPELIKGAPMDQRFYTGMDCYIHCVESLEGTYLNAFSRTYGEKALELCETIFLKSRSWTEESDELLMMASYAGGMSIAYSQVGVAHAIGYGLGFLLGIKHGIGNCIVFNHLEEFYPKGVEAFKEMVLNYNVTIPVGVTRGLSEAEFDTMIDVSLGLAPLWENALGSNWRELMTRERLRGLYERL